MFFCIGFLTVVSLSVLGFVFLCTLVLVSLVVGTSETSCLERLCLWNDLCVVTDTLNYARLLSDRNRFVGGWYASTSD